MSKDWLQRIYLGKKFRGVIRVTYVCFQSWNCRKCNYDMCDKCMSAVLNVALQNATGQPQAPAPQQPKQQAPQPEEQASSRGLCKVQEQEPPGVAQEPNNVSHSKHAHPLTLTAAPYPWRCELCKSSDNLAVVPVRESREVES